MVGARCVDLDTHERRCELLRVASRLAENAVECNGTSTVIVAPLAVGSSAHMATRRAGVASCGVGGDIPVAEGLDLSRQLVVGTPDVLVAWIKDHAKRNVNGQVEFKKPSLRGRVGADQIPVRAQRAALVVGLQPCESSVGPRGVVGHVALGVTEEVRLWCIPECHNESNGGSTGVSVGPNDVLDVSLKFLESYTIRNGDEKGADGGLVGEGC